MRRLIQYYDRERRKGRTFSILLHLIILLLAIFGLPDFMQPAPPVEEPTAITVELLPITGITNVPPSDTTPAPDQKSDKEKAEEQPDKSEAKNAKPTPPVKTAEETPPPPPKEVIKPKEKKKEEKKEPKKEEKKKRPKPQEDLAAVLKAVKSQAQKEKEKKNDKKTADSGSKSKSISSHFDPNQMMSLSEKDAIMGQLAKCWNVPAGVKDAQNLVVVINAEYNIDGSYSNVELARESLSKMNDPTFNAAAMSALRAVKMCSPLKGLPADKYQGWRAMELRFDPKFMLN